MDQRSYKLAVLRFPGNNAEHPASSGWVLAQYPKWLRDPRISEVIPFRRSDTPITMVRNLLVKTALEHGADYILMIDADMQPDVEPDGKPFWDTSWDFLMERRDREEAHREGLISERDLIREGLAERCDGGDGSLEDCDALYGLMLDAEIDQEVFEVFPPATIAAPYCGPPPDECVYVMRIASPASNEPRHPRPYKLSMYDRDHAAQFAGIFEVAALATGLILYDARVFKHLPPPWFEYEWTDEYHTRKSSTEDIYQTRNASFIGMPQFCNWDAWAGHIKPKVVRKPRVLDISEVPAAMADAIRRNHRADHQVYIVQRSNEDVLSRPTEITEIRQIKDTV